MEEDKLLSLEEGSVGHNSAFGLKYIKSEDGTHNSAFGVDFCQKCGIYSEGDLRTIWMGTRYDMDELNIPFKKSDDLDATTLYILRVCKECRASWMKAIKEWFESPIIPETCESGIYVRELGYAKQVTDEEFKKKYLGNLKVQSWNMKAF